MTTNLPYTNPVIAEHLEGEEGKRRFTYKDSEGFLTMGIGRLIDERKGGGLTLEEMRYLLANDIRTAQLAMVNPKYPRLCAAWRACASNQYREAALLSMVFQMGASGVEQFATTLRLAAQGLWPQAADSAMDSKWAKQTPERARRVTQMLSTGKGVSR